jgi:hypothetical protein
MPMCGVSVAHQEHTPERLTIPPYDCEKMTFDPAASSRKRGELTYASHGVE